MFMPRTSLSFCLFSLFVGLVAWSCGGGRTASQKATVGRFVSVEAPASLTPEGKVLYMREHYWDGFDFADTLALRSVDTTLMLSMFAHYVHNFAGDDPAPVAALMERASGSKFVLEYFAMLGEKVLHDPNSPLYSDELYIPVLEALVESSWLDEYEKIAPEYDLRRARKNGVGEPACDFGYTLASGRTGTLYGLRADYTLLFFHNPDCAMCERLRSDLCSSSLLAGMIREGRLVVLALYPDEDLAAWRAHAGRIPSVWIDAYDRGARISREELYDLRAIPSLYLLDAQKRVLVKDAFDVGVVERVLGRCIERSDASDL